MKFAPLKLVFLFSMLFLLTDIPALAGNNTGNRLLDQSVFRQNLKPLLTYTPPLFSHDKSRKKFPYAWGVGIEGFTFVQHYTANKLTLHNEIIKAYSDSLTQDITGGGSRVVIRPGIWVLPYLNLYGIVGFAYGHLEPDITANGINLELPYQDTVYTVFLDTSVVINKPTRYNGSVYGFGATAFYSYQHFFVEVDYNYSEVHPQEMNSKLVSHRFSPKIGRVFTNKQRNHSGTIWVGASWLEDSQTLTGEVNVREVVGDLANYIGEKAIYTAAVSSVQRWNMAVGGSCTISRHFNFAAEVGFLGRKKLALGFMYRF